ncbi:MAG: hypothetical protein R3A44_42615 [Caldilineaceae bacterium]
MANKRVNAIILQVVANQIDEENPPATKQTYERLIAEGFSDKEARDLLGCVVVSEIFDVMKQNKPFNEKRFVQALARLPTLPWDS